MDWFSNINITLSSLWFTFLLSTLAPVVVGFITKRFADGRTKMLTLLGLTVVIQALTELGQSFNLNELLTKIVMGFILSVGLHYQFLKPAGITSADGLVTKILPDVGIGGSYPSAVLPEAEGGPGFHNLDDLQDKANPATDV